MSKPSDAFRFLAQLIPRATRAALEETFWYWLRNIAPGHFQRSSFGKYEEYADSAKRDEAQWRARHPGEIQRGRSRDVSPLKARGFLERAFLNGTVTFTGSNLRLAARWTRLPDYATYRNRYSGFQPSQALTALSDGDRVTLDRLFRESLNHELLSGNPSARTFGGGAAQGD